MKKLIFLAVFSLIITTVQANIAVPQAYISEILVDGSGNWTVELGFMIIDIPEIDSIRIETSSGSSMIANYSINFDGEGDPFDSLSVISVANLADPLEINPSGDFVRIVSYFWGYETWDEVSFGNYPGSYLDCIRDGESVSCFSWRDFCINSSPSIGYGNQEDNFKGHYSGFILDQTGSPITGGNILIKLETYVYLILMPDENGFFDQDVLSRRYAFDTIEHHYSPSQCDIYIVQPVDFCLRPDSSHYQDIIATELIEDVPGKEEGDHVIVTITPNPFSDHVVFYFNLNNHDDNDLKFSIYSLDGKNLEQIDLAPGQHRFEWKPSAEIPRGTYIYRLDQHNNLLKTGKFVRL
jgi:hypothetical protein